jgi:hypothetical protein
MWTRHNADRLLYKEETALLFSTILLYHGESLDWKFKFTVLLSILVADQTNLSLMRSIIQRKGTLTAEDIERIVEAHKEWLFTRSAGLVEVYDYEDDTVSVYDRDIDGYYAIPRKSILHRGVGFSHRSVQEFLLETKEGDKMLSFDKSSPQDKRLRFIDTNIQRILVHYVEGTMGNLERDGKEFIIMSCLITGMHTLGLEDTKILTFYKLWLLPNGQNLRLRQRLLNTYACCGLLVALQDYKEELFDPLPPLQKAEILRDCCFSLRFPISYRANVRHPTLSRVFNNSLLNHLFSDQNLAEGWSRLIKNQISCIQWLLQTDANPYTLIPTTFKGLLEANWQCATKLTLMPTNRSFGPLSKYYTTTNCSISRTSRLKRGWYR